VLFHQELEAFLVQYGIRRLLINSLVNYRSLHKMVFQDIPILDSNHDYRTEITLNSKKFSNNRKFILNQTVDRRNESIP